MKDNISTCKHCGKEIVHKYAQVWYSKDKIYPQYCVIDPSGYSQLHEPVQNQQSV